MKWRIKKKSENKKETQVYKPKSSHSQCGEDLLVQYIFNLRGIQNPSYIDIGAHDPFFLNNTALFYENGSHGINVEANPQLSENFNTHRPLDINLNIGVGNQKGDLDFYIMKDNTLSTFSKKEADFMIANGKELLEIKKVELTTITNILDEYNNGTFPDFMNLDVEGLDFEILQSIDFEKSFPKVICVEAAEYSPIGAGKRKDQLIEFLVSKGYYEYANTNLNAIMAKNEFWFI